MRAPVKSCLIAVVALFGTTPGAMTATAQVTSSSQSSSYSYSNQSVDGDIDIHQTIVQLQLVNTPLVDALRLVGEMVGTEIYINSKSIEEAGVNLRMGIKLTARGESLSKILRKLLPKELGFVKRDGSIVISTAARIADGAQAIETDSLESIDQVAVSKALERKMTVHFDHAPVEMVLQTIAGFANQQIEIPRSVRRSAGISFHSVVTIHSENSTLEKSLENVLDQKGLGYEIRNGKIVVTEKSVP